VTAYLETVVAEPRVLAGKLAMIHKIMARVSGTKGLPPQDRAALQQAITGLAGIEGSFRSTMEQFDREVARIEEVVEEMKETAQRDLEVGASKARTEFEAKLGRKLVDLLSVVLEKRIPGVESDDLRTIIRIALQIRS
jgi:hypothetical protein